MFIDEETLAGYNQKTAPDINGDSEIKVDFKTRTATATIEIMIIF